MYPVALRKTEEGYGVSCPGLPGCWSQGATEQEALDNIRSAIEEYLAARQENARLSEDQFKQGITLASQRDASRAQAMKARAGLLDASLAYLLARDDLSRVLGGTTP